MKSWNVMSSITWLLVSVSRARFEQEQDWHPSCIGTPAVDVVNIIVFLYSVTSNAADVTNAHKSQER